MRVIFILIIAILFQVQAVQAGEQGVAIDYLLGEKNLQGIRLAYRPFYSQLSAFDSLGVLDVYWEISANLWEFGADNRHETNYAIALSPVFSAHLATINQRYLLKWEFGIGISLVEDTRFAGKNIGSHYQFEDRLGLLMEFGEDVKQSAAIRYMHYSNGGLNDNNPGLDFLNLAYAIRF